MQKNALTQQECFCSLNFVPPTRFLLQQAAPSLRLFRWDNYARSSLMTYYPSLVMEVMTGSPGSARLGGAHSSVR